MVTPSALPAAAAPNGVSVRIADILPTHYNENSEFYITLRPDPATRFVPAGLWRLRVRGDRIVEGRFDIWLPTEAEVSAETRFLRPDPDVTLTLPSTAPGVVTVGGYDSSTRVPAFFSGRGPDRNDRFPKPDLAAPAVNILSARAGGGYGAFTGTSYAAPFVTGAAALMMEWGIVRGNSPFLFGQLVKVLLQKGARREAGGTYPNNIMGYGRLCLRDTFDLLL
jgi:subtilisin family serine protease